MNNTKWTKKYYLGKVDNKNIYISPPKWDCGWYWGFGYLGNNNCHYHLNGIEPNKNMYDGLIEHFKQAFIFLTDIEENKYNNKLWTFCELARTAYTLKETAEVLGRGGSHFTTNPLAELIINEAEVKRINEIVLPAIFDKLGELLEEVTILHQKRPVNLSRTASEL